MKALARGKQQLILLSEHGEKSFVKLTPGGDFSTLGQSV
jgi:hypothetical protein